MNIDDRWVCSRCLTIVSRGQTCGNCGFSDADYHPKAHQLPPEALLKQRYLVACVLGEGGFGITYAGWDLTLDKPVAIKEYFPAGFTGRDVCVSFSALPAEGPAKSWYYAGRERFLREARILAMLSGVNGIVPVRDFFEENDTAYIVMDFIHGESLRALADRSGGVIAPAVLLPLLRPVFDALILVHQSGILHRDISPDNILVDRTGSAWLIDFGAAEEILPQDTEKSHAVILRKGYTPLEQYDAHGQQGPWSDLYALGATIYDLLCGQTPPEAIRRVEKDTLLPPRRRNVHLSSAQNRALMRALSPQISGRQRSMEQFRSELYHLPLPEEIARRRKHTPRIVAALIAVLGVGMLLFLNATHGLPSSSGCGFSLSGGNAALRSFSGGESAVVPARYLYLPVTSVSQEAFRGKSTLYRVTLPESLTDIQDMAFLGCSGLTEVAIPPRVTHIGAYAFADCSALCSVTMPESIVQIADNTFSGCPENLVLFGKSGSYVERYADRNGLLFCDPSLFEYSVVGGHAILTRYIGVDKRVVVPAQLGGLLVAAVGEHAFSSSPVESVTVSNGVLRIDDGAFTACAMLREVILPHSITRIGDNAFFDCGNLSSVRFSEGLIEIGDNAFGYDRALASVRLPETLQTLGKSAFEGCTGLTAVELPGRISVLPEAAFYYCDHLASLSFAEGLVDIGDRALEGCVSLAHLRLPESVRSIGYRALAGCAGLQTLYLPAQIQSIDPAALVELDDYALRINPNLVVIGFSGTAAEQAAKGAALAFDDIALWGDVSDYAYVRYEDGVMITGYRGRASDLVMPTYLDGMPVVAIGADAFYDQKTLSRVVLPRRLETILNSAFSYCPNLEHITFPASLRRIDYYAFYRCNLAALSLPASVTTLGYNVFDENPNLRQASFGSGLQFLDETVLSDCPALETLEIASAGCVSGLSDYEHLRAVTLGDGVCFVLSGAFSNCPALSDVYVSASVLAIAPDAFADSPHLTIHAGEGTAAQAFAHKNGMRFVPYP